VIGAPADGASGAVPATLERTTQRQWLQRSNFSGGPTTPAFNAPRVRAGRHDGTPGSSHSSSIR
jgi:hypothetical protein